MNKVLPILFNTEMIQAILDGRKTVTRRAVKPTQLIGLGCDKCPNNMPEEYIKQKKMLFKPWCNMSDNELISAIYKEPYQQGDILYVRETWKKAPNGYFYYEDWQKNDIADVTKWKPSIHMPKEAARIFLKVKDVRVERLQDITEDEVEREGIKPRFKVRDRFSGDIAKSRFMKLWDSTIQKADIERYGWEANPWVWVIEFEQCEKPE